MIIIYSSENVLKYIAAVSEIESFSDTFTFMKTTYLLTLFKTVYSLLFNKVLAQIAWLCILFHQITSHCYIYPPASVTTHASSGVRCNNRTLCI